MKQKYAITSERKQKEILQTAKRMGSPYWEIVTILYYTGMHVKCLVELEKKNVVDGTMLEWKRTKTSKTCFVRLDDKPELEKAVESWNSSDHIMSTVRVWQLVKQVGIKVGMKELSPSSFRQTLVYNLLGKGMTANVVAQIIQCTPELIGKSYGMLSDEDRVL